VQPGRMPRKSWQGQLDVKGVWQQRTLSDRLVPPVSRSCHVREYEPRCELRCGAHAGGPTAHRPVQQQARWERAQGHARYRSRQRCAVPHACRAATGPGSGRLTVERQARSCLARRRLRRQDDSALRLVCKSYGCSRDGLRNWTNRTPLSTSAPSSALSAAPSSIRVEAADGATIGGRIASSSIAAPALDPTSHLLTAAAAGAATSAAILAGSTSAARQAEILVYGPD
jgi:hypothetical protein